MYLRWPHNFRYRQYGLSALVVRVYRGHCTPQLKKSRKHNCFLDFSFGHGLSCANPCIESVFVWMSLQRRLARPAGSWQDRISFSGRVFSFQGSATTEYHVLTTKAIQLGTVSCEDGFARYFCKNDTLIFRYIAFYWLLIILKNFRRFFCVFPDFWAVEPIRHKQKQRHRPKDNPLTGSAGMFPSVFSLVGHCCPQPAKSLPALK